jgi:NAD(P)-dependent dehydrogenase (short-subunit alcohol dehydrogenase family)
MDAELAEQTAQRIRASGCKAISLKVDVSSDEEVNAVVAQVKAQFGRVDILVNNAGTDKTLSIEEISVADWTRVINVNLVGPFVMAKAVFGLMRAQGEGAIVNITSTAAKRAWANASAYHASKWGLLGFSHALHVEGRACNIKVTAVVSGGMRTPFLLDRFPDIDVSKLQDPMNVANTVLFVLTQPAETVIPEVSVLPVQETSWP